MVGALLKAETLLDFLFPFFIFLSLFWLLRTKVTLHILKYLHDPFKRNPWPQVTCVPLSSRCDPLCKSWVPLIHNSSLGLLLQFWCSRYKFWLSGFVLEINSSNDLLFHPNPWKLGFFVNSRVNWWLKVRYWRVLGIHFKA